MSFLCPWGSQALHSHPTQHNHVSTHTHTRSCVHSLSMHCWSCLEPMTLLGSRVACIGAGTRRARTGTRPSLRQYQHLSFCLGPVRIELVSSCGAVSTQSKRSHKRASSCQTMAVNKHRLLDADWSAYDSWRTCTTTAPQTTLHVWACWPCLCV